MNSYEILLTSRFCKHKGYYIKKVVIENINEDNFFDYAIPIMFRYVNSNDKYAFNTQTIRTKDRTIKIQTYGDLTYNPGDKIRIDNSEYFIDDVSVNILTKGFNKATQNFISLK